MTTPSFFRFAGLCAMLAGIAGFAYAVEFVWVKNVTTYSILLMLGGILSFPALLGISLRLREAEGGFALLAFVFGFAESD